VSHEMARTGSLFCSINWSEKVHFVELLLMVLSVAYNKLKEFGFQWKNARTIEWS
jgi:hypothetical protein